MVDIKIRKPDNDDERDWAQDSDRWFNDRDYPEDYVGASGEDVLIADVDGVRCVITVSAPGWDDGSKRCKAILAAILGGAMAEAQIKHMVDRFLTWKLPENFNPDGGISFKPTFNEHTAHPMKHEPSGTNLFDAVQADAMVRHMLEGLPEDSNG